MSWSWQRALLVLPVVLSTGVASVPGCGIACDSGVWVAAIVDAQPGPWQPGGRMRRREVALRLRVDRVLQGPPVAGPVPTQAVQYEPAGSRHFAVPDPWSGLDLAPRTDWVVFLHAHAHAHAHAGPNRRALAESDIRLVLPAASAAADAAFVADARRQATLPLSLVIARLPQQTLNFGQVLGDDLLVRADVAVPGDAPGFAALARLLEQPGLPATFRRQVSDGLVDALARRDFTSRAFSADLALTGFRLLTAPDAAPMAMALRQTWLPALLDLGTAAARLPPATVFATTPTDRARAASALDPGSDLRAWLDGR